tara:strand:+ start:254 stop:376 length:123 start_codon:yes stop_codon:yes gene_type:complete
VQVLQVVTEQLDLYQVLDIFQVVVQVEALHLQEIDRLQEQ